MCAGVVGVALSAKKLSFWPSEVALPFIPAPCNGVERSSCLGVWFAELEVNGLPALDSSCDLAAWFGHLSLDLRELCLAWEAWKFVSDLENLRCNAGSNTLCGFGAMYAFFLMTMASNACHQSGYKNGTGPFGC